MLVKRTIQMGTVPDLISPLIRDSRIIFLVSWLSHHVILFLIKSVFLLWSICETGFLTELCVSVMLHRVQVHHHYHHVAVNVASNNHIVIAHLCFCLSIGSPVNVPRFPNQVPEFFALDGNGQTRSRRKSVPFMLEWLLSHFRIDDSPVLSFFCWFLVTYYSVPSCASTEFLALGQFYSTENRPPGRSLL